MNLNNVGIRTDGEEDRQQADNSRSSIASVDVVFRDLEKRLISEIEMADMVVGCVAWLTNENILKALSKVQAVSIVVQKEDFLRPDTHSRNGWAKKLRRLYQNLHNDECRYYLGSIIGRMSVCSDPGIDPIRCVGNHNSDKSPSSPRMHNKFLVFCRFTSVPESLSHDFDGVNFYDPYSVWTGSFNFTYNATMSFENAVVIYDCDVACSYYHEWEQILCLSEPLDWSTPWINPQWRIGT